MQRFTILLMLLCLTTMYGQQEFTEAEAKGVVDTFFKGFHRGDTSLMRKVMVKDMPMQTVLEKEGRPVINNMKGFQLMAAVANRKPDQKWDERLLDYRVQIDGNLAHVWTPYEFWFNGKFIHCGANSFTLAKTPQGWKIVHLIDSRRQQGCNQ
jgi:hypothetical protein